VETRTRTLSAGPSEGQETTGKRGGLGTKSKSSDAGAGCPVEGFGEKGKTEEISPEEEKPPLARKKNDRGKTKTRRIRARQGKTAKGVSDRQTTTNL